MERKVCLSFGGSVFSKKDGFNTGYIHGMANLIKSYKDTKFIIVVGGGYASREYIGNASKVIENNFVLDQIGIMFTKMNAMLLRNFLSRYINGVYYDHINDINNLQDVLTENRVVVFGGMTPGITTDSVAVLACEATGCKRMINISREAYIYDRNPNEKGAKRLERLGYDTLIARASKDDQRNAGSNFVFDIVACKLAKRSKTEISFVDDDIENLRTAIDGKRHRGSLVK